MKINEKSLVKFASSGAPADKEGPLLKRGELNKGFQKRWFVLKGNLFFYYERRMDKEPIGVVVLEGCTIELAENTDGFTFQIVFPGSHSRTYTLAADTQEEMEAWMKVLACASYDYMKLMVADLQQQIEEMNSETQQRLVEQAKRDSKMVHTHYQKISFSDPGDSNFSDLLGLTLEEEPSNVTQGRITNQRFNPFNSTANNTLQSGGSKAGQKFDFTNDYDEPSEMSHKSFIDLHEEYGTQIQCLSELWRTGAVIRNSLLLSPDIL
ncbi:sesquipedalian-1-like [Mizuhopecten yessoensis]|uniref:sesquipedalian-1-like n=1 Tax=Mizuhopecten yessoensis TaxID=6573 RepID=UPI000B45E065|nr:sesquipedalian-1-like [Mizuhopecten yessoensis]